MKKLKCINEQRMFKKLKFFFDKPASVLLEIAQNSHRAGARTLAMTLKDDILTASDDGEGAVDPASLLVLAESNWAEEVETSQNPAGWGLMYLLCLSRSVTFRSKFGSITVDCDKFFDNARYRSTLLKNVSPGDACDGFCFSADLRDAKISSALLEQTGSLRYFPLDITVNATPVERTTLEEELYKRDREWLALDYQGNKVFAAVSEYIPSSVGKLKKELTCVWYGIPIQPSDTYRTYVYVDVTEGSPLTPVLPYRTDICEDEKLEKFFAFVREKVVEYCIARINDLATDASRLVPLMKTMSALATQQELDRLVRFYYHTVQPYNRVDRYGRNVFLISAGDPALTTERVDRIEVTTPKGTRDYEDSELVVPEDVFTEVIVANEHPSWLIVKEKVYTIRANGQQDPVYLNYDWCKAVVTCEGKDIPVLALIGGCCDGLILYAADPRDAYDIQAAIFWGNIFCEDCESDSRDTQEFNFDQDFERDIMKVTGKYSQSDLLSGFASLGIRMEKAVSIAINKARLTIKFADGSRTSLKLTH